MHGKHIEKMSLIENIIEIFSHKIQTKEREEKLMEETGFVNTMVSNFFQENFVAIEFFPRLCRHLESHTKLLNARLKLENLSLRLFLMIWGRCYKEIYS